MKSKSFILAHLLMICLLITIFIPGAKTVETPWAFVAAIAIIELIFIINMLRHKGQNNYRADLMILLWAVLLIWEIVVTKLDLLHPVLVPSAENVFNVFATQYGVLPVSYTHLDVYKRQIPWSENMIFPLSKANGKNTGMTTKYIQLILMIARKRCTC